MSVEVSVRVKDQIGLWHPDWNCYLLPAPGLIHIMDYTLQFPREWLSGDTLPGPRVDEIVRKIYGDGYFTDQPGRGEGKQVILELTISKVGEIPEAADGLKCVRSRFAPQREERRPAEDALLELQMPDGRMQGFTSAPPRKPFGAIKLGAPWVLPPATVVFGHGGR